MVQTEGLSLLEANWQKGIRGSTFQPNSCIWPGLVCVRRASPDRGHQAEGEACMLFGSGELLWTHLGPPGFKQAADPLSLTFLACCSRGQLGRGWCRRRRRTEETG